MDDDHAALPTNVGVSPVTSSDLRRSELRRRSIVSAQRELVRQAIDAATRELVPYVGNDWDAYLDRRDVDEPNATAHSPLAAQPVPVAPAPARQRTRPELGPLASSSSVLELALQRGRELATASLSPT